MDKRKTAQKKKKKRKKSKEIYQPGRLKERLGREYDLTMELQRFVRLGNAFSDSDAFDDELLALDIEIFDDEVFNRKKNSSRKFKRFWATLTLAQKEALRMVYIKNPERLRKVEVAQKLGIRVDTLQERIDYAVKKLLKYFPEFG